MSRLVKIAAAVIAGGALLAVMAGVASAGVTGPAFYVDGELYRTVGTPTDFSETGAPADSFDTIYQFFDAQEHNVATAAPGDEGYNGGRWQVIGLSFEDYDAALEAHDLNGSGDFDSDEEVHAALEAGDAESVGVVKQFECPVIEAPHNQS